MNFPHTVELTWGLEDGHYWNETCVMVLEVFGLPGDRFVFHPNNMTMSFNFKTQRDADLCKILLSERL